MVLLLITLLTHPRNIQNSYISIHVILLCAYQLIADVHLPLSPVNVTCHRNSRLGSMYIYPISNCSGSIYCISLILLCCMVGTVNDSNIVNCTYYIAALTYFIILSQGENEQPAQNALEIKYATKWLNYVSFSSF